MSHNLSGVCLTYGNLEISSPREGCSTFQSEDLLVKGRRYDEETECSFFTYKQR